MAYANHEDISTFQSIPTGKAWGLGRNLETRLKRYGVYIVGQLLSRHREWVRKVLTVEGERTYQELKGRVCYPLHSGLEETQKSLIVSRSFSREVTSKEQLFNSLVYYANIAGAKLRKRGLWTRDIGVYIRSSPFKNDSYYSNFMSSYLDTPTQDTRDLVSGIKLALERIYKAGVGYKKSGILLGDLTSHGDVTQLTLEHQVTHPKLSSEQGRGVSKSLMDALDNINQRYGRHTGKCGNGSTQNKDMARESKPHLSWVHH